MKVSPLRALTHFRLYVIFDFRNNVEMKVSPLRALTHRHIYTELQSSLSRNESKPVEGIIVFSFRNEVEMKVSPLRALTRAILLFFCLDTFFVEMKVSPLRALTHCYDGFSHVFKICRNGSKPVEGIDTFLRQFHSNGFCKTYRVE